MSISFSVNGAQQSVDPARGSDTLLDYLHDDLNLTGTKLCCGIGVCRACTVSVAKGPAVSAMISCSTPLSVLDGTAVRTVEDIAEYGQLSAIQQAFLHRFSFQCGYCTPGFVMAATVFLDAIARAPIRAEQLDDAIADAIGEHICRCTGYVRYHEAVKGVAMQILNEKPEARK
ncbi:MAG: 2Fe-2S iron-sulfur cluster binding domain-containing protein [Rhodobacter sp.]|nr:2Fe-2S iron-sulfur cluster binding domain-containing protein [Rhodobacter sp.]